MEIWTHSAWVPGASVRTSVPGSRRDGTGEKNTGLRQGVQRVELDLQRTAKGVEKCHVQPVTLRVHYNCSANSVRHPLPSECSSFMVFLCSFEGHRVAVSTALKHSGSSIIQWFAMDQTCTDCCIAVPLHARKWSSQCPPTQCQLGLSQNPCNKILTSRRCFVFNPEPLGNFPLSLDLLQSSKSKEVVMKIAKQTLAKVLKPQPQGWESFCTCISSSEVAGCAGLCRPWSKDEVGKGCPRHKLTTQSCQSTVNAGSCFAVLSPG